MAAMYGFSDQCTAVGTSYFVRLAARDERCAEFPPSPPSRSSLTDMSSTGSHAVAAPRRVCVCLRKALGIYHMSVHQAAAYII